LQEFSKQYTASCLKRHLQRLLTVEIQSPTHDRAYEGVLKMGRNGKKAQISSGWARAMRKLEIKEGKVYLFLFDLLQDGRMSLFLWRAHE
jgi:hypothetical protein